MIGHEKIPFGYYYESYHLPEDFPVYLQYCYIQSDAPIVQLHTHNVMELGYCHEGSGVFNIKDRFWDYSARDVSIISQEEVHSAQSQKGTESTWTFIFLDLDALIVPHFPESLGTKLTKLTGRNFSNIVSHQDHPDICRMIEAIIEEIRFEREFYQWNVVCLLVRLLTALQRLHAKVDWEEDPVRIDAVSLERISPAIHHIQRHYADKLPIDQLAEKCFMSTRTFSRAFQQIFKKSPLDFLLNLRLAMACNQLKNSDHQISFIADASGFKSISSFNRHFQKRFGMSPRVWREAYRAP